MTVGVLLALTGAIESELVRSLDSPGSGVRVVRRCADLPEVLAAAGAGLGTLAVIGTEFGADRAVVSRLRAMGVRTVLAAAPEETTASQALGADVVEPSGTAGPIVAAVVRLARETGEADSSGRTAISDAFGRNTGTDTVYGEAGPPVPPPPEHDETADTGRLPADPGQQNRGTVVAVWGPPGAPGRSTVAIALADELAALGRSVLLADADTEAPSVTQLLGILDDASGIASAARLALAGRLDSAGLLRVCPAVAPGLHVMTGLTRAERWREIPAAALEVIWEEARQVAQWTVVDIGATLEVDGGETSFGPQRHAATTSALRTADIVLVVGSADPVGIRRLVVALSDLTDSALEPSAQRVVLVNRVRASATGPSPERSVREVLARFAGVDDAVLIPDDRQAFDKAVMQARTLRQTDPGSPARAVLEQVAHRLAGVPARRRDRRRLSVLR